MASPQLYSSRFIITICSVVVVGCTLSFTGLEYKRGKAASTEGQYELAVKHYQKVIQREPESTLALSAAREAAKISLFETKNYLQAVEFYFHLVKFSQDERERREAQKKIASLYFENLNDYSKAIEEFNKLLLLRNSIEENTEYRFQLAKAHFNLNHFAEAETELQAALKLTEAPERRFDMMMFLGSIYFNTKRVDQAISVYNTLIKEYPERAKEEKVVMNIIVCYEEAEKFDLAIAQLQNLIGSYPDPDFINLKIKRLQERKANLPGSRGLRK